MKYIVLVTGSRYAKDKQTILTRMLFHERAARTRVMPLWLVHGDARGADRIAASLTLWDQVVAMPAPWDKSGRRAGYVRNRHLIEYLLQQHIVGNTVVVEAFPMGESRGTRGCIGMAKDAGFNVHVTELGQSRT